MTSTTTHHLIWFLVHYLPVLSVTLSPIKGVTLSVTLMGNFVIDLLGLYLREYEVVCTNVYVEN